jgi:chemotaxis protein histidine kinase CheA
MSEPIRIVYYVPAGRNFEVKYSELPEFENSMRLFIASLPADWTVDIEETLSGAVVNRLSLTANDDLSSILGNNMIQAQNVRYPEDHVIQVNGAALIRVHIWIGVQRGILYDTKQVKVEPLPVISGSQKMLWIRMLPRLSSGNAYALVLEQLEQRRSAIVAEFPTPPALAAGATAQEKFAYQKASAQLGRDRLAAVAPRVLPLLGELSSVSTRLRLFQRLLFGADSLSTEDQLIKVAELTAVSVRVDHPLLLARDELNKRLRRLGENFSAGAGRTYSLLMRLELNAKAGAPDREFEVLFGGFTNTSTVDIGPDPGMSGVMLVFQQGRWRQGYEYMQLQPSNIPLEDQLSLRGVFSFANTTPHSELNLPFSYETVPKIPESVLPGALLYRRTGLALDRLDRIRPEDLRQQPEFSGGYIYANSNPVKLELLVPAETVSPGARAAAPVDVLSATYLSFYTQPFTIQIDAESLFAVSQPNTSITLNASRFFPVLRNSFRFSWSGPALEKPVDTQTPQLSIATVSDANTGVYRMQFTDAGYSRTFEIVLEIEAFCKRCRTSYKGSENWFGACHWHSQHPFEVMGKLRAKKVTLRSLLVQEFPEEWLRQPVIHLLDRLRDGSYTDPRLKDLYSAHEARLEDVRCLIWIQKHADSLTLRDLEGLIQRESSLTLSDPAAGLFDPQRDARPEHIVDAANGSGPRNPNLLSGHGRDAMGQSVNLCCRLSDEMAAGCWTGVHSPSTAVPELHDWLLIRQRGSEHLHSQHATARQHELIMQAGSDVELLLEREEWFNTVHGGQLVPQFVYSDSVRGAEALEAVLSHPGTALDPEFGEKLRQLYDTVQLSQPFRCWTRNELFAQRYDERNVVLPVYPGGRRTRTVQLIGLFADLHSEPKPQKRVQKLDIWLREKTGLSLRMQYFRAVPQIVQGAIDDITTEYNNVIPLIRPLEERLEQLRLELFRISKRNAAAQTPTEFGLKIDGELSTLDQAYGPIYLEWSGKADRLETDRDNVAQDVYDFGYNAPLPTIAEWEKHATDALADVQSRFTTGSYSYPQPGSEKTFRDSLDQLESDLKTFDFDTRIDAEEFAFTEAQAAFKSAWNTKVREFQSYLSTFPDLADLTDKMIDELARARAITNDEAVVLRTFLERASDPRVVNAVILKDALLTTYPIFSKVNLDQGPLDMTPVFDKIKKTRDLKKMTKALTAYSIPMEPQYQVLSSLLGQKALGLLRQRLADKMGVQITSRNASGVKKTFSKSDFLPTPGIVALAKKVGGPEPLNLEMTSKFPPLTVANFYDLFVAILDGTPDLAKNSTIGLPYQNLREALLNPRADTEAAFASYAKELYDTMKDTAYLASTYTALVLVVLDASLNASDYQSTPDALAVYLQGFKQRYESGINAANIAALKLELAYLGGEGTKPVELEDAERLVAASKLSQTTAEKKAAEDALERQRLAEQEAKLRAEQAEKKRKAEEADQLRLQRELAEAQAANDAEAARKAQEEMNRMAKQQEETRRREQAERDAVEAAEKERQRLLAEQTALEEAKRAAEMKAEKERLEFAEAQKREAELERARLEFLAEKTAPDVRIGQALIERPLIGDLISALGNLIVFDPVVRGVSARNKQLAVKQLATEIIENRLEKILQAPEQEEIFNKDIVSWFKPADRPGLTGAAYLEALDNINSDTSVLYRSLIEWILRALDTVYAFEDGKPVAIQYLEPAAPVVPSASSRLERVLQIYLRDPAFRLERKPLFYAYTASFLENVAYSTNTRPIRTAHRAIAASVALAVLFNLPLVDAGLSRDDPGLSALIQQSLDRSVKSATSYYTENPDERQFILSLIRRLRLQVGFSSLVAARKTQTLDRSMFSFLVAQLAIPAWDVIEFDRSVDAFFGGISRMLASGGDWEKDTSRDSAMSLFLALMYESNREEIRRSLVELRKDELTLWEVMAAMPNVSEAVLPPGGTWLNEGARELGQFRGGDSEGHLLLLAPPKTRFLYQEKSDTPIFLVEARADGSGYNAYDTAKDGATPDSQLSGPLENFTEGSCLLQSVPSLLLALALGRAPLEANEKEERIRESEKVVKRIAGFYEKLSIGQNTPATVAASVQDSLWLVFRDRWSQLITDMSKPERSSKLVAEMRRVLSRESIDALVAKKLSEFSPSVNERDLLLEWIADSRQAILSSARPLSERKSSEPLIYLAEKFEDLQAPAEYVFDASQFYRILYTECEDFLREVTANYTSARDFYSYLRRREAGTGVSETDLQRTLARLKTEAGPLYAGYEVKLDELQNAVKDQTVKIDYDELDELVLRNSAIPKGLIGAPIQTPDEWKTLVRELGQFTVTHGSEAIYAKAVGLFLEKRRRSTSDAAEISKYNADVENRLAPLAEKTARRLADYCHRSGRLGTADQLFCYMAMLFAFQEAFYEVPSPGPILRFYLITAGSSKLISATSTRMIQLGTYLDQNSAYIRELYGQLDNALFANSDPYDGVSASYRRRGAPHTLSIVNGELKIDYSLVVKLDLSKLQFFQINVGPFDAMSAEIATAIKAANSELRSEISDGTRPAWVKKYKTKDPAYTPASPGIIARQSQQIDQIESLCLQLGVSLVSTRLDASRVIRKASATKDWVRKVKELLAYPYGSQDGDKKLRDALPRKPVVRHPPITLLDDQPSKRAAAYVMMGNENSDIEDVYLDWDFKLSLFNTQDPNWRTAARKRYDALSPEQQSLFITLPEEFLKMGIEVETDNADFVLRKDFNLLLKQLASDLELVSSRIAQGLSYQPSPVHTTLAALFSDPEVRVLSANLDPAANVYNETLYVALDASGEPVAVSIWQTDANVMESNFPGFVSDVPGRTPTLEAFVPLEAYGNRPDLGHVLSAVAMLDARFCDGKMSCYKAIRKAIGFERVIESPTQPALYFAADLRETVFAVLSRFRPAFPVTAKFDTFRPMQNLTLSPKDAPFLARLNYGIELDSVAGNAVVRNPATEELERKTRSDLLPIAIDEERDQPSSNPSDLSVQLPGGKWMVFFAPPGAKLIGSLMIGAPEDGDEDPGLDTLPEKTAKPSEQYTSMRRHIVGLKRRREYEQSKGWIADLDDPKENSLLYIWVDENSWTSMFQMPWFQGFYDDPEYQNDAQRIRKLAEDLANFTPGGKQPKPVEPTRADRLASETLKAWKTSVLLEAMENYLRDYYAWKEADAEGESEEDDEESEQESEDEEGEDDEDEEEALTSDIETSPPEEGGEEEEEQEEEQEEEEQPERKKLGPRKDFVPSTDYSRGYDYFPPSNLILMPGLPSKATAVARMYPYLAYCPSMADITVAVNLELARTQYNKPPRHPMIRSVQQPTGSPIRSSVRRFFENVPE